MTEKSSKNKHLIFVPDISGYTKFVNETEIEHSQHIISELLEIIINSDKLSMKVSEIEGDAVLFYCDNIHDSKKILEQCTITFLNFHNHLSRYNTERICRCGACETASKLSLKFIVHVGDLETIKIGKHEKIHGPDVILAHKLLKNSVQNDEYVLFCGNVDISENTSEFPTPISGSDYYETYGDINYSYIELSSLHNEVSPAKPITFPKLNQEKISIELKIAAPMDIVYDNFTNFDSRLKWSNNIQDIIGDDDKLIKTGSIHTCLVGSNSINIETLGREETESKIIYGERINKFKIFRDILTYYTLEDKNDYVKMNVDIDFKIKSFFGRLINPIVKKMFEKQTLKGLNELKTYCEK